MGPAHADGQCKDPKQQWRDYEHNQHAEAHEDPFDILSLHLLREQVRQRTGFDVLNSIQRRHSQPPAYYVIKPLIGSGAGG